jgi:ABC-type branched-subunit amino acid transport system substrate-binding protein
MHPSGRRFQDARPSLFVSGSRSAVLCAALALTLLAACAFPGSVKPTVKLGLSAPFEGEERDLGYEVLHAVRLAVRQRNETGGVADRYLIELVALNDFGTPEEAVIQARKMAVDSDVLGVLGGWSPESSRAAIPEYQSLGLAFLYPDTDWSQGTVSVQSDAVPGFEVDYQSISGGAPPGPRAVWAYKEANRLLDAFQVATVVGGHPTRAGVLTALEEHR